MLDCSTYSVHGLSAVSDADRDTPTYTYTFNPALSPDYFKFNSGTANQIDTKVVINLDSGQSDPDS